MITLAFIWPCSELEFFIKAYSLSPPKELLSRKFLDEAASHFNYEHVVKSWMENPSCFLKNQVLPILFHGSGNHFHYWPLCYADYMVRQIAHISNHSGFRQPNTLFLQVIRSIGIKYYLLTCSIKLKNT